MQGGRASGGWGEGGARARPIGPSRPPVLQALLEPHLGAWELISQFSPIGGANTIQMRKDQAV